MTGRLADRVAVVTGGGAHSERVFGIGEATCRRFAAEDADVVVVDVDADMVELTTDAIADAGDGRVLGIETDLTDEKEIAEMADEIADAFGTVDVLVNNAGIRIDAGPVTELDADQLDYIYGVNLRGMALASKHVIPLMADGGSIVNISSANAELGRPGWSAYDATKAGVLALTRDMACDHAEEGIRVNSVLPGPTVTDYHLQGADDPEARIERSTTPRSDGPGILGRNAHPREIAGGVLFLATEDASYVTGAALPVDGGLTAAGY